MSDNWKQIQFSKYNIEVLQTTQGGISGTGIIISIYYSLGWKVWNSAYLALRYIEHLIESDENLFKGKHILDLSAGCGLVGIAIAVLGGNVVVSETGENQLKLLQKNVDHNLSQINSNGGSIKVVDYAWGNDISCLSPPFDYIFMCDLLFIVVRDDLMEYFTYTLEKLIKKDSINYLIYEERTIDKERAYISQLQQKFVLKSLEIKEEWMKDANGVSDGEFAGLSDIFNEDPPLELYLVEPK